MYDKIMVPLDGSRFSNRALEYAIDLAPRYGASLLLAQVVEPVNILPPVDPSGMSVPTAAEITVEESIRIDHLNIARAKRYLSGKVHDLREKGIAAEYIVLEGHPADEILKAGKKAKVDLIVMATHGRTGLRRVFMGSVADKVIRESGDPVLVVRPKQRRKKKSGK